MARDTATPPESRLRWLRGDLNAEIPAWVFIAKSMLAFFLTAWIAMRLQLESPSTSMITVSIVMHPQTGMVLAKSFYRAFGTIAGCLFGLLVMALFPQQRELFLSALALWVGLCAGAAVLFRNFTAYAFVLAGYTAAIVVAPVLGAGQPEAVFDSAVMRFSEVMLGIVVASVVSDGVFPARLRSVLRLRGEALFAQLMNFVRDATGGRMQRKDMEKAHLDFVHNAVELEDLRSNVIFEDAEARARSRRLLHLNHYYMAASTSFQALHRLINRMLRQRHEVVAEGLIALYRPLADELRAASATGTYNPGQLVDPLAALAAQFDARAQVLRGRYDDKDEQRAFDTGASILHRFVEELAQFVRVAAALRGRRIRGNVERIRFTRGHDYAAAAIAVVRTTAAIGTLCICWVLSGWVGSVGAVALGAAFTGLYATAPQPVEALKNLFKGYLGGCLAAAIMSLLVLPGSDGFGLFVACMLPALLIGSSLVAHPSTAGMGSGYLLGLINLVAVRNLMMYDQAHFFNDMLSQIIGVGLSLCAYLVIPSAYSGPRQRMRLIRRLRHQVVMAATGSLAALAYRFESASRDITQQIVSMSAVDTNDQRQELLAWSLSVNEIGRSLIELRHELPDLPSAPLALTHVAIDAVADLFSAPAPSTWQRAEQAVTRAIEALETVMPTSNRSLHYLYQLRGSLRDDESAMAELIAGARAEEADHAA